MSTVEKLIQFPSLGGNVTIYGRGLGATGQALEAEREIRELHDHLTRFEEDSELSRLNRDERISVPASPVMLRLAEAVSYAGRLSKGLVDATMLDEIERAGYVESIDRSSADAPAPRDTFSGPRGEQAPPPGSWRSVSVHVADQTVIRPVGVRIDSGGLGKGMAADIAAEAMRGLELFSVECSGDLRIGGSAGEMRSIDVASPADGEGPIARILLSEGAVATSGVTRRSWQKTGGEAAHHLIDPRTGRPADTGLVQVTAVAPTALEAEVRTKAALLSGPEEAADWLVHGGLVVIEDGGIRTFGENVETGVPA